MTARRADAGGSVSQRANTERRRDSRTDLLRAEFPAVRRPSRSEVHHAGEAGLDFIEGLLVIPPPASAWGACRGHPWRPWRRCDRRRRERCLETASNCFFRSGQRTFSVSLIIETISFSFTSLPVAAREERQLVLERVRADRRVCPSPSRRVQGNRKRLGA